MVQQKAGKGFFVSGGTLPPGSPCYVQRNADKALLEGLLSAQFCYVLTPRQMGKSSLSVHAVARLEEQGIRVALLDLTRIGGRNLTAEQWYTGLAVEIGRELEVRTEVLNFWTDNASLGPAQRFFGMLRDVVLAQSTEVSQPIVIVIDEIDVCKTLNFDADEFFAAIRECFNRRVSDSSFSRLTFCLLGVGVPGDLVQNRAATPFNIGERIALEDFSVSEMLAFGQELGPLGESLVKRVHYWTAGHPYLSQSICRSLASLDTIESIAAVDEIVRKELFDFKARDSNINLSDVANVALNYGDHLGGEFAGSVGEQFKADLLSAYGNVLKGRKVFDDDSSRVVVVLKLSGLVGSDGRRLLVRNRIYAHVFDQLWIEEHMPEQELRRQRQSYRRGMRRTALIATAIIGLVSVLAVYAWYSRQTAITAKNQLAYQLYVADINSLRTFYENGDTARAEEILTRHRNSPFRNFEWNYWLGQFHDSEEEYTLDFEAPGKQEQGHLSADGKEICIIDALSSTATIVDRASQRRIKTIKLQATDTVIPLTSRWVIEQPYRNGADLIDFLSGKRITTLGNPSRYVVGVQYSDHSESFLTNEASEPQGGHTYSGVWNAVSARPSFTYPTDPAEDDSLPPSRDGRILARSRINASGGCEVFVVDLTAHQVIDRFTSPSQHALLAMDPYGKRIIYRGAESSLFCRSIRTHKSNSLPPSLSSSTMVSFLPGEDKIVALLDGARGAVADVDGSSTPTIRSNVYSIQSGSSRHEYLASATTVRLYNADKPSAPRIVAAGTRLTHYGSSVLNVFRTSPSTIEHVDDGSFKHLGNLPDVHGSENLTYGGHWYLSPGTGSKPSLLVSADGSYKPIPMPTQSNMWACGYGPEHIAVWNQSLAKLTVFDGLTGRTEWTLPNLISMDSMWMSPDARRLYIIQRHVDVSVFDTATGKVLGWLDSHNLGLVYITFSSNQKRVFTCGGDGRAVMWDASSLRKITEFRGNGEQGVTSADLSPDGKRVVTSNRSGTWELWDADTGFQLLGVKASLRPLSSAVFCSDGKRILTAGEDGQVREWGTKDVNPTVRIPTEPSLLMKVYR